MNSFDRPLFATFYARARSLRRTPQRDARAKDLASSTHDPHIQADIHNFRERPAHGTIDPFWFVAKGSTAQPGQKQHVEPEWRALITAARSVAS